MVSDRDRLFIGLPQRITFYHPDQICEMLVMNEDQLFRSVLWLAGRRPGKKPPDRMLAHNVAADDAEPQWRIDEIELVRWAKYTRFKHLNGIFDTPRRD